ncbi:lytic transglycosylase domain-containing protein [Paenibacillus sp. Marseille-Q4541]|uniref:lytic transglycosylase domain-containing protein n=1 Tax=Paenibacillus sp. Marseille-Q4541 TaxID=2831522 RepID=UPI001BA67B5F|nr:lytic transglycosylase domain-containing protein [Paenibacillus sp. Marseille-Q4541]
MHIDPVGNTLWYDLTSPSHTSDTSSTSSSKVSSASSASFEEYLGQAQQGDNLNSEQPSPRTISGNGDGLLWMHLGNGTVTEQTSTVSSAVTTSVSSSTAHAGASKTDYQSLIEKASQKYGVSESLIKAVIDTESSFNPNVVSSAGAKGLMQLMDGTAAGLGVSDPFDPAQSIDAGTRYLSYQLQRFNGEEKLALAAYNAGPGRVGRLGVDTDEELMSVLNRLPLETQRYITKIEQAQAKYTV